MATTLRFSTAGSVDDGKSTLIGRLLLDAKALLEDQLAAVAQASERRGAARPDLSLVTDGLVLEREQGITIDVAYRYFATPSRRFIIADAPGHEQYTRNMVTGASTADLSVVLVDAARGISRQTRRHAAIAALLGIPHVVLAVNKMDRVGWSRETFAAIAAEFALACTALGIRQHVAIPLSALEGDMVVDRGGRLGWYAGPTLLEALERASPQALQGPLRFPVQLVTRTRFGGERELRGYQGRVESGVLAVGDTVVAWPQRTEARVQDIVTLEGTLARAGAGRSVTVVLDRQVDVARGDLLTHVQDAPLVARRLRARLAWMDREPLRLGARYWLKHGTRTVPAHVESLGHRLDLATLRPERSAATLAFNDLGSATLALAQALPLDAHARNRATGSFVLVDATTHQTAAAGMIDEIGHG